MKTAILLFTLSSAIIYQFINFIGSVDQINAYADNYNILKVKQNLNTISSFDEIISEQDKVQGKDSVKLNIFTQLPADVQGCTCNFYLSRTGKLKKQYIMTEIFAQIAYISINGKVQKFNLVAFKDKVFYHYSNGTYLLNIEFKNHVNKNSENFTVAGTLTLLRGHKVLDKRNIIGDCGC